MYQEPDGAIGVKQYVMDQVKLLREELQLMGDQIRKLDAKMEQNEIYVKENSNTLRKIVVCKPLYCNQIVCLVEVMYMLLVLNLFSSWLLDFRLHFYFRVSRKICMKCKVKWKDWNAKLQVSIFHPGYTSHVIKDLLRMRRYKGNKVTRSVIVSRYSRVHS